MDGMQAVFKERAGLTPDGAAVHGIVAVQIRLQAAHGCQRWGLVGIGEVSLLIIVCRHGKRAIVGRGKQHGVQPEWVGGVWLQRLGRHLQQRRRQAAAAGEQGEKAG
jgi:hypothetical protein